MITNIKNWFLSLDATTIVLLVISIIVLIAIIVTIVNTIKINRRAKRDSLKTNEQKNEEVAVHNEGATNTAVNAEVATVIADDNAKIEKSTKVEETIIETPVITEDKKEEKTVVKEKEIKETVVKKEALVEEKENLIFAESDNSEIVAEEISAVSVQKQVQELDAGREIAEVIEEIQSTNRKAGKITIYKDKSGKFRFQIVAANYEPVGHSQAYATKASCKVGVKAVLKYRTTIVADMTNIESDYIPKIGTAAFEIFNGDAGKYRFRLRSKNYRLVLASQDYTTKAACNNGVEAVKRVSENYSI